MKELFSLPRCYRNDQKLNWVPDVIHLNGWMASLIPIYLKTYYKDDSYFKDTKIVLSVYNEEDIPLKENTKEILEFDNISDLESLDNPTFLSFVNDSMNYVDVIVKGMNFWKKNWIKLMERQKLINPII
jgi:starch synthase